MNYKKTKPIKINELEYIKKINEPKLINFKTVRETIRNCSLCGFHLVLTLRERLV
jgi:hypothetical protein